MDIFEYKRAVITLFKSGSATDEQWEEMSDAVLRSSEADYPGESTRAIDKAVGVYGEEEGRDAVRFTG